jgi:3-phenylpropionate/trans-cinnamate dioxygenase ferredoxin reductase subunit
MAPRIVVIGAGQAAAQLVDVLRRKGHEGPLCMVGDEPWLPYQRPPLSKTFLQGSMERDRLLIRHETFYAQHRVDVRLGRRALRIEREAKRVWLDDGAALDYDLLVIATGSRARHLTIPGSHLPDVHYLRSIADVERIRAVARPGARAVVVGGGYIGLEVAASCRQLGVEATVFELAGRVMNRVVCDTVSRFYEAEHARHGVTILLGAQVEEFVANAAGRLGAVRGGDGTLYPADFAVVGIGVLAEDALAIAAGLECENGIRVDAHCRSSDPAIFAIGDCANQFSPHYGVRLRLESVDNAFEQANTAALNMLGTATEHDKVPWFWSDQFHHKLLIVGISQGHDEAVLRGDPASGAFSVCYLRAGELVAVDTINSAKDQMAARRLIAARAHPDVAKLRDVAVALKDCL